MTSEDTLNRLLNWVAEGAWISRIEIDDVALLLDAREESRFCSRWMEEYDRIDARKSGTDHGNYITKIRESVYLQVFDRWNSPDLAAYISEDFGLISDAIVLESASPWVTGLFRHYLDGRVPAGEAIDATGELTELVP